MNTTNLDTWFSRFIRLRDADENGLARCCTCGVIKSIKQMDNGHYIKRQHMATRYSEMNCNIQCKGCNKFEQGNDVKYRKFLVEKYGETKVLILEASKRKSVKLSSSDIKIMTEHYKAKVKELLKEKGISKWW